eukprot:CAMPEP_0179876024 /NCGR_PEP_ID=MMETSP0982-20121206/23958_1 /TAXON_ID=483367 /ORGANISM="non described non described, Strain CCMP 2436" /LENGTH=287 /DNA_ID=CAMNT_0021768373 /DNA_START=96 /DNA_END=959 /DNA_ORIENTATION=+
MQQQSRYRIDFLLPVLRGLPLPSRSRTRKAGVSRLQPARSCHRVAGARADRTQSAQRHSRVEVPLRDFAQYPSASISTRLLPSVPVRCGKHLSASLSTRPLPSVPVRCGKHPGERRRAGGNLGLLAPTGLGEPLVELVALCRVCRDVFKLGRARILQPLAHQPRVILHRPPRVLPPGGARTLVGVEVLRKVAGQPCELGGKMALGVSRLRLECEVRLPLRDKPVLHLLAVELVLMPPARALALSRGAVGRLLGQTKLLVRPLLVARLVVDTARAGPHGSQQDRAAAR